MISRFRFIYTHTALGHGIRWLCKLQIYISHCYIKYFILLEQRTPSNVSNHTYLWDLRFPQHYCWRFKPSGMWHHVFRLTAPKV